MPRGSRSALSISLRIAAFVAVGGLIAVAQLDRATDKRPGLAAYVPEGLGGYADGYLATANAVTNPQLALPAAESAIRHRPIPANHLSAYALAQAELGNQSLAAAALSLAATRGWRDQYTQITVLGSAIAAGRLDVAVQRLEALIRTRRDTGVMVAATKAVLDAPGGAEALAGPLANSEMMREQLVPLLRRYPAVSSKLAQSFSLAEANRAALIPCGDVSDFVRLLLDQGEAAAAFSAWPNRCAVQDLASLAFVSEEAAVADPFRWNYINSGAVAAFPENGDGSLRIVNRNPARKLAAYRFLTLTPGRHEIRVRLDQSGSRIRDGRAAKLELRLVCGSRRDGAVIGVEQVTNDQQVIGFDVPANCMVQNLGVTASRGRVTGLKLELL